MAQVIGYHKASKYIGLLDKKKRAATACRATRMSERLLCRNKLWQYNLEPTREGLAHISIGSQSNKGVVTPLRSQYSARSV